MTPEELKQIDRNYRRVMGPHWSDWAKVALVGILGGAAVGALLLFLNGIPMGGLAGLAVLAVCFYLLLTLKVSR